MATKQDYALSHAAMRAFLKKLIRYSDANHYRSPDAEVHYQRAIKLVARAEKLP